MTGTLEVGTCADHLGLLGRNVRPSSHGILDPPPALECFGAVIRPTNDFIRYQTNNKDAHATCLGFEGRLFSRV